MATNSQQGERSTVPRATYRASSAMLWKQPSKALARSGPARTVGSAATLQMVEVISSWRVVSVCGWKERVFETAIESLSSSMYTKRATRGTHQWREERVPGLRVPFAAVLVREESLSRVCV